MNRRLSRLIQPGMRLSFLVLILFTVATALFKNYSLAAAEAVVIVLLFAYYRYISQKNRRDILKFIDSATLGVSAASRDSLDSVPLPMALIKPGREEIIWSNEEFREMAGIREHVFELRMEDVIRDFPTRWLTDGANECPEPVTVGGKRYRVYGSLLRGDDGGRPTLYAATYWVDVSELLELRDEYNSSRPVVALILIDNYDEITKNLTDTAKSTIVAAVDERITGWAERFDGILRKTERDMYIFIFEERHMQAITADKFSLLDSVREVTSPAGIAATISVGIGRDCAGYREGYEAASLSIEMALSRGGDQAVIKDRFNFSFFGGRARETERRTKVKSRVMANSLGELISGSSQIFIMGHKNADIDAIGAAAGLQCICRKKGKKAFIVTDLEHNAAKELIGSLSELPEYEGCFIGPQEALLKADSFSLLIVVDTNRPDQVESQELLMSIARIAIVDHHRRAADYIENVTLNFHEPFASSASELVAELLQYSVGQNDILRAESEALLAGIVLDTKNFSVRTGGRTFDAAAFLRRAGADPVDVKKIFQNDLDSTVARYEIIQRARLYRGNIAIAALDEAADRTIAAQAADELLNISGILTSFVLYPDGERIICSARSIGDANVQMILEPLGGGGNAATAGAQIPGKTMQEVLSGLVASIDNFFEDQ